MDRVIVAYEETPSPSTGTQFSAYVQRWDPTNGWQPLGGLINNVSGGTGNPVSAINADPRRR